MIGHCGGCENFKANLNPDAPQLDGYCHAGPPQLVVFPDRTGRVVLKSMFPPVKKGEGCGAFVPLPETVS